MKPEAEAGQRRALEAGRRLAAEELVAGRRQRDEAQDRRHAGRRRGALEQARRAEDRQARRQPGQDDRDRRRRPGRRASPGDGRRGPRGSRRSATGRARSGRRSRRTGRPRGRRPRVRRATGRSARYSPSIAPVRPVLKRSVKVPSSTNRSDRSIRGSVAAPPPWAGPGPYHARNVQPRTEEEAALSRVAIFTDSASDLDPATPPRRGSGSCRSS